MGIFYLLSTVFSKTIILTFLLTLISTNQVWAQNEFKLPSRYTVHRTAGELAIDGKGDEASWQKTSWSNYFVDIEGDKKPKPYHATRLKMLWDDEYLYFYATMEEPHIWATLKERDAVIFQDNDFEIFIDPDGDTHNYFEFEVNAFNTVWDLLLTRPYRDGGRAINAWDIKGLKSAVHINGTINDPSDVDKGWSVEVAIPWAVMKEGTHVSVPPKNGHQWRLNFSRVQWKTEVIDGKYVKEKDSQTGENTPPFNWVWTPQRAIAMHEPEFWGIMSFTDIIVGQGRVSIAIDSGSEQVRQLLYRIHRNQKAYKKLYGVYSDDGNALLDGQKFFEDKSTNIELELTADDNTYHAIIKRVYSENKYLHIDHTGRIWTERTRN